MNEIKTKLHGLPIYFGCNKEAGHYAWSTYGPPTYGLSSIGPIDVDKLGVRASELDTLFLPLTPDGAPMTNGPEGLARLTYLYAPDEPMARYVYSHTILSFCDRSVDRRAGSHSTFAFEGELRYEEALQGAMTCFPAVFARFGFGISRWEGNRAREGGVRYGYEQLQELARKAVAFRETSTDVLMATKDAMWMSEGYCAPESVQPEILHLLRERRARLRG